MFSSAALDVEILVRKNDLRAKETYVFLYNASPRLGN